MRTSLQWALVLSIFTSCSPVSKVCGPSNCTGCCDLNNECQNGVFPTACGSGGMACQLCTSGLCNSNGSCAVVVGTAKGLRAYKPTETTAPDRKGTPVKTLKHEAAWAIDSVDAGAAVIAAGEAIICGGSTTVAAVDTRTQKVTWSAEVDGAAYGLAVASSMLAALAADGLPLGPGRIAVMPSCRCMSA